MNSGLLGAGVGAVRKLANPGYQSVKGDNGKPKEKSEGERNLFGGMIPLATNLPEKEPKDLEQSSLFGKAGGLTANRFKGTGKIVNYGTYNNVGLVATPDPKLAE